MARDRRDFYYHQAKQLGYRSRASFKLKQINEKHRIISQGDSVVDLGAAPGGWLQVAKELSKGKILGVDLQVIEPIEGVQTIRGNINADSTIENIIDIVGKGGADVVICDAAPNLSGNWAYDHARSIELTTSALECAKKILKPDGTFVVKVFQGDMFGDYMNQVRANFVRTSAYTPKASRTQSAEIYVIGKKYLTTSIRKGNEFVVKIDQLGTSGDGAVIVNGLVVFVEEVEIGETVRIVIEDVKPNLAFASVLERNVVDIPKKPVPKNVRIKNEAIKPGLAFADVTESPENPEEPEKVRTKIKPSFAYADVGKKPESSENSNDPDNIE